MKKARVTIVIPIHLEEPSELEKISLTQTLRVLNKYPITFMTKAGLNTAWYEKFCQGKATIYFEQFKWQGFEEFGELMTKPKFYCRFRQYEYILICHMDAFVFRDELEKWCELNYDHIGSVIYNTAWDVPITFMSKLLKFTAPEYYGNGGFSLKKVETFFRITSKFDLYIKLYHFKRRIRRQGFLDDIFMAQLFPNLDPSFQVPPKVLAQHFGAAYENWNEKDLPFCRENCSKLLFGMHGWIQYNPEFWKASIREYGYPV